MPWTFYNASGEALTSFGPVALTDLDIDGGTAIGEAVVGADLFIMDNGAGGTNVKVTATEIATFIGADTDSSVRVTMSGAQSIANATAVTLLFGAETYDTDAFHDNSSNTGRLTVPSTALAGKYVAVISVRFAGNTTGERIVYINHSADGVLAKVAVDTSDNGSQQTELTVAAIADLANGEYVTAIVNQNSGGALNVEAANTNFCMIRIA